jgi:hypothetical protein
MVLHHWLMLNQHLIVLKRILIDVVLILNQIVLILQEIDHEVTKILKIILNKEIKLIYRSHLFGI